MLKIPEDLAVLKPTFLPMVPRLLNRFHDTIQSKINELPEEKRATVRKAIDIKWHNLRYKREFKHPELDEKVFKPFINLIGGNV